jgi:hypothetical protein
MTTDDDKAKRIHVPITHTVRTDRGGTKTFTDYTRQQAISLHCTECMGYGNPGECTSPLCALYAFRRKTL